MQQLKNFYQKSSRYREKLKSCPNEYFEDYIQMVTHFLPRGKAFADLGCGTGQSSSLLSKHYQITGVDISPLFLKEAQKKFPQIDFIKGNILQLPFRDNSFDGVGCFNVLEHIPAPQKAAAEIIRITKKGGLIFICCPNLLSPKYFIDAFRQNKRTFLGKMNKKDLAIKIVSTFFTLTAKKFGLKPKIIVHTPNLKDSFPDTDAVWLTNPIDVRNMFIENKAKILSYQEISYFNKPKLTKIASKLLPAYAGIVRLVAQKNNSCIIECKQ